MGKELGTAQPTDAASLNREGGQNPHPWHQTWWATLVWSLLPIMCWYALYVCGWKLTWRERGKYLLGLASLWTIVVAVAGVVELLWN